MITFPNLQEERRLRNNFRIAIAALICMTCIYGWREHTLYQTEEQNYALLLDNASKDAQIQILSGELNLANEHLHFLKLAIAPATTEQALLRKRP